jgi:transcription factor MAFF/G/K
MKRIEQKYEQEMEKSQEYRDMEAIQDDNNRMKDKIEALKKFAALKKILIPPELESIN